MLERSLHNLLIGSAILVASMLANAPGNAENGNLPNVTGSQTTATIPTSPSTATKAQVIAQAVVVPDREFTTPAIKSDESFPDVDSDNAISQVNSVSELSDVQPSDWAFQALQSLVERYGCIAGYPDRTYRGNHAITRYEFAAGLSACLSRINELIATGTSDLVIKEDLTILQKLQTEFATELATLRGRVDAIDARTAELESHQFSATTKLLGEAIFALADGFRGTVNNSNTVFQDRIRLKFQASFTGKDFLNVRLAAGNTSTLKLPGGTAEGLQTFNLAPSGNQVYVDWLSYYFPIGDRIDTYIGGYNGVLFDFIPTLSPYLDSATGGSRALTEFASSSPIYRIGGGTGGGINYKISDKWVFSLGYLAGNNANPASGSGLFNGQYSAITQILWSPNKKSGIGLTYANAYQNRGAIFDLGGGSSIVGTAQANTPFRKTITNSYGIEAFHQFSPQFAVNGFFGYTNAKNLLGKGSADIWYYALELALPDLGKKGNLGGIVVGAEPYRGDNPAPANDISLHIEGFYKYQLTDGIAITPGVIWITAPGQNADNSGAVIGTIRTTFLF